MKLKSGKLIYTDTSITPPVRIFEKSRYRWLQFSDDAIQSAMSLDSPQTLVLEYMRRMMSFLLFMDPPGRSLHAGIGAGAMLRFFHHHWPQADVHAVDNHEPLIHATREHFGLPPLSPSSLHLMDVYTYLTQVNYEPFDIILADLFDGDSGSEIWTEELVQLCFDNLAQSGFLIINMLPHNAPAFTRILSKIRDIFSRKLFCMTVPEHDNIIVFACRSPSRQYSEKELLERAGILEKRYSLEMYRYCENILQTNHTSPLFTALSSKR